MKTYRQFITELNKIDKAMWIDKRGNIIDLGTGFHIRDIVKNPTRYDLSSDEIEKIYNKHAEEVGIEGKARREIITKLISKGWIHVKFVMSRQAAWSITLQRLDNRTKDKLFTWANDKAVKSIDRYADVVIVELKNNKTQRFSLDKISSGDF